MSRLPLIVLACATALPWAWTHAADRQASDPSSSDEAAIRRQLQTYLDAFNKHDAATVASFWSLDCVSVAEDSGERIAGREALQQHFSVFFKESRAAKLTGEVTEINVVRPDVALIDGRTRLFVSDSEPVESTFSALLVKDGDKWLIRNSRERDVPTQGGRAALQELDWLVGTWKDQSDGAQVRTTVRWSPNRTFLIRSFKLQYPDEEPLQGTQVIGWDPRNKQIRTWTFSSDGSFGEGTVAKHEEDWVLKTSQVDPDGGVASASQVITPIDQDTMKVQVVGETVNGEPVPTSMAVTVVRVRDAGETSTDGAGGERGEKP